MIELEDLIGLNTTQHIHQVINTKALTCAVHGRECLLRCLGAIPGFDRVKTGITVAANGG